MLCQGTLAPHNGHGTNRDPRSAVHGANGRDVRLRTFFMRIFAGMQVADGRDVG